MKLGHLLTWCALAELLVGEKTCWSSFAVSPFATLFSLWPWGSVELVFALVLSWYPCVHKFVVSLVILSKFQVRTSSFSLYYGNTFICLFLNICFLNGLIYLWLTIYQWIINEENKPGEWTRTQKNMISWEILWIFDILL